MEQTLGLMLPHLPLPPPGFTISPSTSLPPPVYALDRQSVRLPSINGLSLSNAINGRAGSEAAPARTSDEINGHGVGCVKPDDWTWARLTHKKRVTADEWWQDVREIELESEDPNE